MKITPTRMVQGIAVLTLMHGSLFAQSGDNLLLINPSFEEQSKFMVQHGKSDELPGWLIDNTSYDVHAVFTEDGVPDGNCCYVMRNGGVLETSSDGLVTAIPGLTYQLTFSSQKTRRVHGDLSLGVQFSVVFYDVEGKEISAEKTAEGQKGGVTEWEKLTTQTTAPEGAVKMGVRVSVDRGPYPKIDGMDFKFDDFSISKVSDKPAVDPAI